ncbi:MULTISPECIES: sporulation histidine kinase inhibitor Sda [Bacillaceae]|uniref:Acyl-CoA synthetase n=1 Tax=Domibacillus aminovorans TaxID=29332 RepID=A0A177KJW8_9BACI|nr:MULTISPECIES: sporulation histidine kinase inhibitor Sda [Bacillaceae]OAH52871.1 acyl-CoA synthetase [Domibacillus aminovorans]OAH60800.1 acyl-CoA synthetase [Domibacillus aminovorans]
MKIMSNELLVAAYRDALNNRDDKEWINALKIEVRKRGLSPKNEK